MFKFLKDKLKSVVKSFSGKVEGKDAEPAEEAITEEQGEKKKGFFHRVSDSVKDEQKEAPKKPKSEKKAPEKPAPKKEKPIDADQIEGIIRDIDLHTPLDGESEPEPVPEIKVEEEQEEPVLPPPAAPMDDGVVRKVEAPKTVVKPEAPKPELAKPTPGVAPKPSTKIAPPKKPEHRVPVKAVGSVEEKSGIFGKLSQAITTTKIDVTQFENLFWELEVALLENNVAVEVIEKLKFDLKDALVDKPLPRGKVEKVVTDTLRASLNEILGLAPIDIVAKAKAKKPFVICFVGVNGSGKTTSIAKVANMFLSNKMSVVLAAADTFRAAAIDQLEQHGNKLGVKVIKQDYGSDPAAVAFDAIKHATAKGTDVVLIDTAGRLHSNVNLIDEMRKIVRVAKPDMTIFVGESITGNDCVEQAKQFDEAVGIDGIILSKADVDDKGGAAISVSYVTRKPILYIGTGQEYADIELFDRQKLISSLGL